MQLLIVAAITQFAIGAPFPNDDFDSYGIFAENLIKSTIQTPVNSCNNDVTTIEVNGRSFGNSCSNINVETGTDDHSNSNNGSGSYPNTSRNTSDYPSTATDTSTDTNTDTTTSTDTNADATTSTDTNTDTTTSPNTNTDTTTSTDANTDTTTSTDTNTDTTASPDINTNTTASPDANTDATASLDNGDDGSTVGKGINAPIHYPVNECNNNVRYAGEVPIYDHSCVNISVQSGTDNNSNQ